MKFSPYGSPIPLVFAGCDVGFCYAEMIVLLCISGNSVGHPHQ